MTNCHLLVEKQEWTDKTLNRFASTVATAIQANNESMQASNERWTRIEAVV